MPSPHLFLLAREGNLTPGFTKDTEYLQLDYLQGSLLEINLG